jgi:hypothetical protein
VELYVFIGMFQDTLGSTLSKIFGAARKMAPELGRGNQPEQLIVRADKIRTDARSGTVDPSGRDLKKYLNWSERP